MNYSNIGTKCIIKTRLAVVLAIVIPALILALLALATPAHSQTVKPSDKVLKDTLIKSVSYKLYLGSRGGRYVIRTSASGNVYKQYIKAKSTN